MISHRDQKYFDVARAVATLSTWSELPRQQTGAVLVLRNEIIATGYNRAKSHPMQKFYAMLVDRPDAIYAHAEISAMAKIRNHPDRHLCKLYVYRETTHGFAMARPCEICSLAIKDFRIQHVYYTTNAGLAYERFI